MEPRRNKRTRVEEELSKNIISAVIRNCYSNLVDDINPNSLVDDLFQMKCISEEEKNIIRSNRHRQAENRELLDILITKDDMALAVLLSYLAREQRNLFDILQETNPEFRLQLPAIQKRLHNVCVLGGKWWPEPKPLINSFIERRTTKGNELIIDSIHRQLLSHQNKSTAIISNNKQLIVGMGGIGKTTIAKWYANQYQHEYTHIIWIESEGQSLLKSFQRLAKKLNPTRHHDPNESIEDLLEETYARLEQTICLFIFDNAESYNGRNGLKSILPRNCLHYSIITSRYQEWGNASEFGHISTFKLDVFTPTESVEFLSFGTNEKYSFEMEELGKELGYLPLALQVAVATINKQAVVKAYTISSYLERLKNDIAHILSQNDVLNEYERSTSASLRLAIEQIETNENIEAPIREICKNILYVAAYCLPDEIDVKLFKGISIASKYLIEDAIQRLLTYSLISSLADSGKEAISIHRLLQIALRAQIELHPENMTNTFAIIFKCMESDLLAFAGHANNAWEISKNYDTIARAYSHFPIMLLSPHIGYIKSEKIQPVLSSFTSVYGETDIAVVQLNILSVYNSIQENHKDVASSKRIAEDLINKLTKNDQTFELKQQLLVHAKLLLAYVTYHSQGEYADYGNDEVTRGNVQNIFRLYKDVVDQLETMPYYDGTINGHALPHRMLRETATAGSTLPFRIAIAFDYVELLSEMGQAESVLTFLWDCLADVPKDPMDSCYANVFHYVIRGCKSMFPIVVYQGAIQKCYEFTKLYIEVYSCKSTRETQNRFSDFSNFQLFSDVSWEYTESLILQGKLELAREVDAYIGCKEWLEAEDVYNHLNMCLNKCKDFIYDKKFQAALHLCHIISENSGLLFTRINEDSGQTSGITEDNFYIAYSLHSIYIHALVMEERLEEALALESQIHQICLTLLKQCNKVGNYHSQITEYISDYSLLYQKFIIREYISDYSLVYEKFRKLNDNSTLKEIYRFKQRTFEEIIREIEADIGTNFVDCELIQMYDFVTLIHCLFLEFEDAYKLTETISKQVIRGWDTLSFKGYRFESIAEETVKLLQVMKKDGAIQKMMEIMSKGLSEIFLNERNLSAASPAAVYLRRNLHAWPDLVLGEVMKLVDCDNVEPALKEKAKRVKALFEELDREHPETW